MNERVEAPLLATLHRIAAALERLAPPPPVPVDPLGERHLRFDGGRLRAVDAAPVPPLDRFVGIDAQRDAVLANLRALAAGRGGHDMLLWGARGMGKSALVRAGAASAGVRLVEAGPASLAELPALFALLPVGAPFLIYVDDLVVDAGDAARRLRSLLDGGVTARPGHVRLAVTSNHRHLMARRPTDSADVRPDTSRHWRDDADDQLALADRFGLILGFHAASQDEYLEMVRRHAAAAGLAWDAADALAFAAARGGRSGRTAWHYARELEARG